MDICITNMKKEHIPEAAMIEAMSFSLPWSENAFEESLSYDHTIFLVAVLKGTDKVAGYIGMYKVFNEGEITNVAVHPKYRGMGIGTKLMESVIRQAEKNNIKDIILEVRQSNSEAIRLYEKNGFKKIKKKKNFYEKPVEDGIVMHFKVFPL